MSRTIQLIVSVIAIKSLLITSGCGGSAVSPAAESRRTSEYLYVVSESGLVGFGVTETGNLQPLAAVASGRSLRAQLTSSPNGQLLFSLQNNCANPNDTSCFDNAVLSQRINADGSLSAPLTVIPSQQQTINLLVSPDSRFLYALSSHSTNTISVYGLAGDGSVTAQQSSAQLPIPAFNPETGGQAFSQLIGFGAQYLWASEIQAFRGTDSPSLVSVARDATTGGLSSLVATDTSSHTEVQTAVAASPFLVVAEASAWEFIAPDTVSVFRADTGTAQFVSQCNGELVAACKAVTDIAVHPNGRWIYVLNRGNSNGAGSPAAAVAGLALDNTSGTLSQIGAVAALPPESGPFQLAIDPSGHFLFVIGFSDSAITVFSIDGSTGGLNAVGTTSVPSPTAMAVVAR